jgi:hypothetical protein
MTRIPTCSGCGGELGNPDPLGYVACTSCGRRHDLSRRERQALVGRWRRAGIEAPVAPEPPSGPTRLPGGREPVPLEQWRARPARRPLWTLDPSTSWSFSPGERFTRRLVVRVVFVAIALVVLLVVQALGLADSFDGGGIGGFR